MKAQPAVFFVRPSWGMFTALLLTASLGQAQTYRPAAGMPPGAIQQPTYRQSGSAYVPQGPSTGAPNGYQPGYGTPPNYQPPPIKSTAPSKPKSTSSTTTKRPASLETKVARLEKNDAQQDRRLNHLELGSGQRPVEGSGSATSGGKVYLVRPGDTLWGIASKHSTSINAIKSANRLTGETIAVGQTLIIPGYGSSAPASASSSSLAGVHIVRPGDTFSQIAQANGITQDALARANPSAYPDRLLIGERIVLPGKSGNAAPTPTYNQPSSIATSRMHVVKKGESLGAIAKSYGVPTATMAAANKLKNANLIEPGQRLIVPGGRAPSAPAPTYPPVDSDTTPLPGAGLYAITPAPAPQPPPAMAPAPAPAYPPISKSTPPVSSNRRGIVAYRLERGDDINTVSNLFNTTPEKIRELNKMSPDHKIKEGDEVVVPSLGAVSLN